MKLPLTLLLIGVVSFFPEIASSVSARLAVIAPVHRLLLPAASFLARYHWLGAACLVGAAALLYTRFGRRPEKKLL